MHLGTTAGYLGSKENDNNGFSNTIQVPFIGTYLVATKGRFFADLMVREDFYNINLNNPGLSFFGQPVGAHGYSISTSAGYNFDAGQGWFIEPSAGFIYSKTSVDRFISGGVSTALNIPTAINTNDIESEIGRLSLRVGRTIETPTVIWQPFASASVFHEFAGNVVSNCDLVAQQRLRWRRHAHHLQPDDFDVAHRHLRPILAGCRRSGREYRLARLRSRRLSQWRPHRWLDRQRRHPLPVHAGNDCIRDAGQGQGAATPMSRPPTGPASMSADSPARSPAGTDLQFVGAPFPAAGERPWVFGGIGGIELGYNYQFANQWVIGVEGDVGVTNLHGGRTAGTADGLDPATAFAFGTTSFDPALFTIQDKTNWMATVTGRVGYAWGRTLFYVKGGAAFEDSSTTVACAYGPTGRLIPPGCCSAPPA